MQQTDQYHQMSKRHVLVISSVPPALTGIGIAMRAGSHVLALAEIFDVTLLIPAFDYTRERVDALIPPEIKAACARILVFTQKSLFQKLWQSCSNGQFRLLLEAVWPVPGRWARNVAALHGAADALGTYRFDAVYCIRLQNAAALPLLARLGVAEGPVVLDLDDYESHSMARLAERYRAQLGRQYTWLRQLEARKWAMMESLFIPRFGAVLVCSEIDRDRLTARFPQIRCEVVPNVAAPPLPVIRMPQADCILLFVGALDYMPNRDAVMFFCDEVLPLLAQTGVKARVLIVGRSPDDGVLALGQRDGVEVVASPPEIAPYYAQADIALAPLRSGGGTRIKILEAFSHAIPVVATTIGAEGIDGTAGRDLLIGDTAADFAEQCLLLIRDPDKRAGVGQAGRAVFDARYSADILPPLFRRIFAETAHGSEHSFNATEAAEHE